MDNTLPCIICDKKLKAVEKDLEDNNQPHVANVFFSNGHYGATIFDPNDQTYLEINICTDCLRIAAKKNKIYHVEPKHIKRENVYRLWNGKVEDEKEWTPGERDIACNKLEPEGSYG